MSLFDDMKVAYADKSDRDLKRAYFLFKIISNPFVTKILTFFMKVSIGIGLPIKGLIKATVYLSQAHLTGPDLRKANLRGDNIWEPDLRDRKSVV